MAENVKKINEEKLEDVAAGKAEAGVVMADGLDRPKLNEEKLAELKLASEKKLALANEALALRGKEELAKKGIK